MYYIDEMTPTLKILGTVRQMIYFYFQMQHLQLMVFMLVMFISILKVRISYIFRKNINTLSYRFIYYIYDMRKIK